MFEAVIFRFWPQSRASGLSARPCPLSPSFPPFTHVFSVQPTYVRRGWSAPESSYWEIEDQNAPCYRVLVFALCFTLNTARGNIMRIKMQSVSTKKSEELRSENTVLRKEKLYRIFFPKEAYSVKKELYQSPS